MFNTAQQAYIDALLPTYAKEGYEYYVVFTNTMVDNSWTTPTDPDLYAIFSKSPISAKDAYTYVVGDASIIVTIRSVNYSNSSSGVNTDRMIVEDYAPQTLKIPVYEHVYTNADFATLILQPDYYLASGGETNVQLQSNTFLILAVVIFIILNRLWFGKR